MTLQVSDNAQKLLDESSKDPNIVFEIDGISKRFGAVTIKRAIRIGDPDLFIGDTWVIGGSLPLLGQRPYVSFEGTSTSIQQQLRPDEGAVSSVSSLVIRLIDKNQEVTKIISPSIEVVEIMGRKAKVLFGLADSSFPEDYVLLFQGLISDVQSGAGWVEFTLNHPDEKKRQDLFAKTTDELVGNITNVQTNLTVIDGSQFILPADDLTTCVIVESELGTEIIEYTGKSGNQLTGLVRGKFGTTAIAHPIESPVNSFYVIEGLAIEIALKIMLSGVNGNFRTGVEAQSFNEFGSNTIYFLDSKFAENYGLVAGDKVSVTGAAIGANNVTNRTILQVVSIEEGAYIVIDGASLALELDTSAVCAFRSKYDVLGIGLRMTPEEVDVEQHEFLRDTFLGSTNMRFYFKDLLDGKEFLEKEIYLPMACFSVPRKGRSSVGLHISPLPTSTILTLNKNNIKNPDNIKIRRSLGKNFHNVVIYKYDEKELEDDFSSGKVYVDAQSIDEIGRRKKFEIEAKGLRTDLQGSTIAATAASRRLNRYKRGAEFIDNIEVFFGVGAIIEVGDIVILDPEGLNITNTEDGTREKPAKLFEVVNKKFDIKKGLITLNIIDTTFDGSLRYGLISPASIIDKQIAPTQIFITASFSKKYGVQEWRKWSRFIGAKVIIRNAAFSSSFVRTIVGVSGNTITLDSSVTVSSGWIMEFAPYADQIETVKLIYTFMSDDDNDFADGGGPYRMI